jgi:hypothetical protein
VKAFEEKKKKDPKLAARDAEEAKQDFLHEANPDRLLGKLSPASYDILAARRAKHKKQVEEHEAQVEEERLAKIAEEEAGKEEEAGGEPAVEDPEEEAAEDDEEDTKSFSDLPVDRDEAKNKLKDKDLERYTRIDETREWLAAFIKYNQHLKKFDLAHTNLPYEVLVKIGACLSKARGLSSISLSGNPGVNEPLYKYVLERIKCKPKYHGLQLGAEPK